MHLIRSFVAVVATTLLALPAIADDVIHFKGLPASTIEQAVANISEYNNRLETILAGELTPEAMVQVHKITYTLENALEKLDDSIDDIENTLEIVHKASERADTNTVKSAGEQYLSNSRKIIK